MFFEKKLPKNLVGIKKVCTFASAFAQKLSDGTEERVL
jgi:hypothetical protein